MTYVFVTGGARVDRISQDVTITDNTILSNIAGSDSGAVATTAITGTRTISGNTFTSNVPANILPP